MGETRKVAWEKRRPEMRLLFAGYQKGGGRLFEFEFEGEGGGVGVGAYSRLGAY